MTFSIRGLAAAMAGVLALAFSAPAHAEWRRAESPNFVVYSQSGEAELRRYVRNLEIYDYVLRIRMGLPTDRAAGRKLPIYLVGSRQGLVQINLKTGQNVAGTYFPVAEGIFAAAIRDESQDFLLHEYFHHFSFQMGSTANYPGWLREGLAEYFMTAEIKPGSVAIGGYNEGRVYALFETTWLPLEDLLRKTPHDLRRQDQRANYYSLSWLMTHWFMSDEGRRGQLLAYLADIHDGGDPVEAMQRATGLTLTELRQQLRNYRRLSVMTYTAEFPQPEITITTLPRSADDLLLIAQRLKVGVDEDKREETAALVRRLAARHPDDSFAQLQLGHAELHFGDAEAGEAVLARLLEREPDNIEALQLMGDRYIDLAGDRPEEADVLLRRARGYLARAYRVDEAQYYTLYLIARTRVGQAGYPNENDLVTWDRAFALAPQLSSIRIGFGSALMGAGEFDEAITVLTPLANSPHGGTAAAAATLLVARAKAGQAPFSDEAMTAAIAEDSPAEPEPQTGDEAQPEPEPAPAD
ncbi:hypothetical protein [Brevundimonas sp. Root1279]|uniref:hypothetical protein n=1 Tax=Brevundimonas sp. Root1279 TaxID=1736443 RepID=UPI0006FC859B|nr:hypothetical protein [Brevundimonas sp. Root1279]KQW83078.1 hypothetical protein ASC65_07025 [Brevundimonas sp. Root1279]